MIDDWKCLNCSCTHESGCELERETNETLKRPRVRFIPSRLAVPPVPMRTNNPEAANAYGRKRYRERIERFGGTVRPRKSK